MGGGSGWWEVGGWRWELGGGRWEVGGGRWEVWRECAAREVRGVRGARGACGVRVLRRRGEAKEGRRGGGRGGPCCTRGHPNPHYAAPPCLPSTPTSTLLCSRAHTPMTA